MHKAFQTARARLGTARARLDECSNMKKGLSASVFLKHNFEKMPLAVSVFDPKFPKKGLSSLVFLNQNFQIFKLKVGFHTHKKVFTPKPKY